MKRLLCILFSVILTVSSLLVFADAKTSYNATWTFKANAKGEIFPINEETNKADFGYWGYYEDKVSTNKAFVISTTSFRAIAGKGITIGNSATNPTVLVEIDKVATNQSGVNFLNESDEAYKTVDGKKVFDNYYLTFYGTQAIASDFTVTWKLGCTYGELLEKFGLNTNESEKVTFHLNIDGKDSKLVVDYGKVNLYDEVEIEIERKAGSTLGKYILSAEEVKAPANGGSNSGSGSSSGKPGSQNPNTGAPVAANMSTLSVLTIAAAAAAVLKMKKH